jgi:putative endonuclease
MAGEGDPRRRLGARGEELAARHLEARGYQVVERNFRTRYGELDVVARDARFLVFCEVKTRIVRDRAGADDVLGPFAAIGLRKQRQVRAMAREWLTQSGLEGPRPPGLRFDAIGISFDATGRLLALEHLEAAF